jgi:hypothetical protein
VKPLPQFLFDVFALSLPRGHGFGDEPPGEAWQDDAGHAIAAITQSDTTNTFGVLVMRRREDLVWSVSAHKRGLPSLNSAREMAARELAIRGRLPVPPGTPRRPPLYDLQGREPSKMFKLLTQPSHIRAAWMLNQLYLALPNPDPNWATDCQTANFHTRLWEALLLACLREQGHLVTQPHEAPDFRIENRRGGEAWIEAVTANPRERFEHVGAIPTAGPSDPRELFLGPAALRFAKTLGSKLQRRYDSLPHVKGKPLALALADFHAPGSMIWSRQALGGYLYGMVAEAREVDGRRIAVSSEAAHLLGDSGFPAGLFRDDKHAELSAVIFSNAATIGKLNRVAVSAGGGSPGLRWVRYGEFFDRRDGATKGIPFSLDVASDDYRRLWTQGYEPWSAELEVYHNPHARHPLPRHLLPEATHWFEAHGEIICAAHHETSVLWSQTLILSEDEPIPSYEEIPTFLQELGERRRERAVDGAEGNS